MYRSRFLREIFILQNFSRSTRFGALLHWDSNFCTATHLRKLARDRFNHQQFWWNGAEVSTLLRGLAQRDGVFALSQLATTALQDPFSKVRASQPARVVLVDDSPDLSSI